MPTLPSVKGDVSLIKATRAFHDQCPLIDLGYAGHSVSIPLSLFLPIGRGLPQKQPSIVAFSIPRLVYSIMNPPEPAFPPMRWIPFDAPIAGDNFNGIDRTRDVWRLAGGRYNGTAESKEEALMNSLAILAREGALPTSVFLHKHDYQALLADLAYKSYYSSSKLDTTASFLKLNGPYGSVEVWPDLDVPENYGYILQMDTWQRDDNFGTYCTAPGYNLVVRFK